MFKKEKLLIATLSLVGMILLFVKVVDYDLVIMFVLLPNFKD